MSEDLKIKPEEAKVLVQFIDDTGIEYLAESCENRGLSVQELIEKLVRIAHRGQ